MNIINGNVTSPIGFSAGGANIGLKKDKKDMAVIVSEILCTASGCFTTNVVKAAPVLWDMQKVNYPIKGIVANSGNANACTGQQGIKDCEDTAARLASHIGVKAENVLVCSTGVIGVNLDMDKILNGVDKTFAQISSDFAGGESASHAIMTTDTHPKTAAVEIEIGGKKVTLAGMAKGSGMINPNMATMLCFITTDCAIEKYLLDKALKACVLDTFNMISVDGDTSTNDTVLVIANGMAENPIIKQENEDYEKFKEALFYINKTLAVMCADDGEGATKLMEVNVTGCADENSARLIAQSVTSSNLLKCALFGEDANWGRVLCAMGYSGGKFDPMGVTINFRSENGEINLMDKGTPIVFDEDLAAKILSAHNIYIDILLEEGEAKATAWGCDLTYDYVKINGDYRS
ncbi:MAG: bifunctional glutamate N-acetyltransferase/amino-acid acetyltransferase ArgJ [Firmicutes bacterium]|nr:bifunctional glutamate N-acetyltransferase/amino-acid acetyltransferase ArgJ [Bacillota bacterium]